MKFISGKLSCLFWPNCPLNLCHPTVTLRILLTLTHTIVTFNTYGKELREALLILPSFHISDTFRKVLEENSRFFQVTLFNSSLLNFIIFLVVQSLRPFQKMSEIWKDYESFAWMRRLLESFAHRFHLLKQIYTQILQAVYQPETTRTIQF